MVGITNLPDEVVYNHLFPYLQVNDVLRLRRVCQWIKPLAEDYLRLKATTSRRLDVSLSTDKPNNLSAFLNLSLTAPMSNIAIENDRNGQQIWDMEEPLSQFLSQYGSKISKLNLSHLELPMSTNALAFFESLPNLKWLEVDCIHSNVAEGQLTDLEFPLTFRNLTTLSIESDGWKTDINADQRQVYLKFLEWCQPNLHIFGHVSEEHPPEMFEPIRTVLIDRENCPLAVCDLQGASNDELDHDELVVGMDFYRLLTACDEKNVELWNVDASLINLMFGLDSADVLEDVYEKLSCTIASLWYLTRDCFLLELPNLERVMINGTSICSMPEEENYERMSWPNLNWLEICVDEPTLACGVAPVSQLLDYLFVGIRREKLEFLEVGICEDYVHEDETETTSMPYPRALDIGESCPNLKQLCLTRWPEDAMAISKLWEKLPLLEKLEFQGCVELGTEAFVGETAAEPSFLKLINLRSLTLKDLSLMPKIKDDLFYLVLRQMPIKELYLRGCLDTDRGPVEITVDGIKSLLTGVFADSIERFPLVGKLKLKDVSDEELAALENEFRSARML